MCFKKIESGDSPSRFMARHRRRELRVDDL